MSGADRRSFAAALLCAAMAAGCVPSLEGNEPRGPHKEVPATFGSSGNAPDAPSQGRDLAQVRWDELFADPELDALIDAALANNQELNIQLQEIIIAQNEVSASQGEYLPKVNAGAGAGVEKVGRHTSQGVSDEAHGVPENLGNFTFGLAASWEVDVWSKLRNATKAAALRYRASVEARNFMVTQLVAEIARSYYELVALDNEIDVLQRNIALQADGLEAIKLEMQAARVTALAVQRFEAEVLKNKAHLYEIEQQRVQAENRINFLVGRYPQPVKRHPEALDAPLPKVLQAGLPSRLLDNRPDVRQAALELEAAKLDVAAAKAAFYPSLTIDAALGYRSFNLAHLIASPASLAYGLAGNLTAPLLNRKAIEATYRSANARQIQAVYHYEQTLLQAFTDVVNQLALFENSRKSQELLSQQVETLTRSVDVSTTLFRAARADYMEVLLTRRDALEAELDLIETKKRRYLAMINVYQALGGGWRSGG